MFNTVPKPFKGIVTVIIPASATHIVGADGDPLAVDIEEVDGCQCVHFVADLPGTGYKTWWLREGGESPVQEEHTGILVFENAYYSAAVQPDGTFSSVCTKPSGMELIGSASPSGNLLRADDSTGLSPLRNKEDDGGERPWGVFWERWQRPGKATELHWKVEKVAVLRKNSLGQTFVVSGALGNRVSSKLTIHFYHQLPWIDLRWDFTFDDASIGTFYDSNSKLRVQWPLAFTGDIFHDQAFGVVQTQEDRPFFPANWVDVSDGEKGFAYFHNGTLRHWVSGDTLFNLYGWGEETDSIGGRSYKPYFWPKRFDQRLRGNHSISCAVFPHPGDWRSADVAGTARAWGTPPATVVTEAHKGNLASSLEGFRLLDPDVVATAVMTENESVVCGLYNASAKSTLVRIESNLLHIKAPRSLKGETIQELRPFQIGELVLKPI